jgi:hypothetical protein
MIQNGSEEECELVIQQMLSMDNKSYLKMNHSPILIHDIDTMIQNIAKEIKSIL